MPTIQERAEISTAMLGLALTFTMLGLIASQAAAGALVARFGSRGLVTLGLLGWSLALIPVAVAESFAVLAVGLAMVGLANGLLDVSMNVHGLTVEQELRRPMFTGLHAAFSFGGLGGAAVGALVAGLGVGVAPHLLAASAAAVAIGLATRPLLLPAGADAAPGGPLLAVPTRGLVAVGALAFCTLLAEGAVNDWAAVYLDGELGTTEAVAATGLAVFSLTMGIGRLAGDRLAAGFGPVRLTRAGAALAALGMSLTLVSDLAPLALAGFAVAGLGLATLFPMALRAAGRHGESVGPSVAAVAGCGYLGLLTGPPSVGGLSELTGSLRTALVLVVVLCLAAVGLAGSVREPPGPGTPRG
ncbi:MAG TPA: MFS transporter [Thermoleophilaceae bacterium]|nr:MFS transporter [Thermoleophilaceae bacterium]